MGGKAMRGAGGAALAWALLLPLAGLRAEPITLPAAEALARGFGGIGRLISDGRAVCTAVLIAPDQAVTAAHCVADRTSGALSSPDALRVALGDAAAPVLRPVLGLAVPPDYASTQPIQTLQDIAPDIALLQLAPLAAGDATPLPPLDWDSPTGAFVDILGFQREGPADLSLREGCMVIGAEKGAAVVNCDVVAGLSGAAVVLQTPAGQVPRLVAMVSSRGQGSAFVVEIAPWLDLLRAALAGPL